MWSRWARALTGASLIGIRDAAILTLISAETGYILASLLWT